MKRFIQLVLLCFLSLQLQAFNYSDNVTVVDSSCSVDIALDSTAAGLTLTANPSGTAPFTYNWSTGETTQTIIPIALDTGYCVTVVDADGCEAWDCFWNFPPPTCSAVINMMGSSADSTVVLTAVATGQGPFTYQWNYQNLQTQSINAPTTGSYSVTVTAADGCVAEVCCVNFISPPDCEVNIYQGDSLGITILDAIVDPGSGWPVSWEWNTGETTQYIEPQDTGLYCVTITTSTGCTATDCFYYSGTSPSSCDVYILVDSSAAGGGNVLLTAMPNGNGPFTYQWNIQNFTTQSIMVPGTSTDTYCVTITAVDGCTAEACATLTSPPDCSVSIYEVDSMGITILDAIIWPGIGPYTYLWSNGETTREIEPVTAGTYCVTITTSTGCTAEDCYFYDPLAGTNIQGYVYLPDSLNPVIWTGVVELYQFDPATGDPVFYATTNMDSSPNGGYFAHYDFGSVDFGDYIIKATIDPSSPISADYLPTYYGDVLEWNMATVVDIPSNQWLYNITMDDGMMLTGPGSIGGLVSEGDGLLANEALGRNPGDPMEGVSVLLFNEFENSITHTVTDVNGKYSFGNLPYGTYKIMVEIVGLEQGIRWVTLSPGEPNATEVNFNVNETEIVNGIAELVNENGFNVYPNPTSGQLNIRIEATNSFEGNLRLTDLTGSTIFAQVKNIVKGEQLIGLDFGDLPTGVYFLQLTTGSEVVSRKVVKD